MACYANVYYLALRISICVSCCVCELMLWLALVVHLAENPRDLRGLIWLSLVFKALNMQPLGKLCVLFSFFWLFHTVVV